MANFTTTGSNVYPAGHIIQVVTGTYATETSTTSTSYVSINSALEPAITVTGSNKVWVSFNVSQYGNANGVNHSIQCLRDSTALGPTSWGFGGAYSDSAGGHISSCGGNFLDTPGAGSHNYRLYHRVNAGTGYACINTTRSTITLFEIQA